MKQPLAYVHPAAKIHSSVIIDPFVTIEQNVEIGEGTRIGSNVTIMEGTRIGKNCTIFPGAVLGAVPQDLKFQGEDTKAIIGDNTVIRECVTVHRGTASKGKTIGLANPSIGPKIDACIHACERLGFPEARIPLSVLVIEMCLSPKSNSAEEAINKAISDLHKGNVGKVPKHLKTNSKDYLYPHSFKGAYVKQQYLPDELVGKEYYVPKETSKFEKSLKSVYEKLNKMND